MTMDKIRRFIFIHQLTETLEASVWQIIHIIDLIRRCMGH